MTSRFSVPPDEIERARIADAAGDDFESDAGTGITNPVRPKTAQVSSSDLAIPSSTLGLRKLPVPVLAGAGVLVVLLIIIVVLLSRGDDEQPAVTPLRPEDPRVVVDPPVDPPPPDPPADPALTDPAVPPPDPTPPAPDGAVDPNVDPAPDPAARPPDPTRVKRPEPRMSKADIDSAILQARTFYLQGKHEKAIEAIKPVTKADKNNDAAWKLLGMAAQKLGKLRTMCTAYDELLRLQPTGVDAEQARANRKAANCK